MKEKIKRTLCAMLCFTTAFAASSVSACSLLGELPSTGIGGYGSNETLSGNSSGEKEYGNGSSVIESASSNENGNELPPTDEPDPGKTLVKRETDSFGHEIAYYSDGTWEDLGRVKPLDFTPKAAEERFGYQSFTAEIKGEALCAFYADLYEAAIEFSSSTSDIGLDEYGYYSVFGVDHSEYGLTNDELTAVWKIFKQDCPEFYWIGSSSYILGSEFYVCTEAGYTAASVREETQDAIEAAALACDAYLNGKMSPLERAVAIYDYLAASITYAYEADGVTPEDDAWAHDMSGWATRGAGVCETYAESFTYLCNLFGLESSVIVGVAAQTGVMGAHAWNILKLDGEWYTVDVTWDDGFESAYEMLIGREWFGKAADEFAWTHVADIPTSDWGSWYQFALPVLSEKTLSPVLLSENGGEAVMVASLDKAFEKMTNEGSRYEITLYPETEVQLEKGLTVYPVAAKLTTDMPKVAQLVIKGGFVIVVEETKAGFMPKLQSEKVFTLGGNLFFEGLDFETVGLNLNGYTLTLRANASVYSQQTVTGGSLVRE